MTPRASLILVLLTAACQGPPAELVKLPAAGGTTTEADRTSSAFENPAPGLSDEEIEKHFAGDVAFEATYVSAPAEVNPGLGPVFNHNACAGCHLRNGRGLPITGQGPLGSPLLVRVSLPDGEPALPGGAVPVPGMGDQIGDHAIYGHDPEASVVITWTEVAGEFGDGTPYSLRRPTLTITLPDGTALSDRVLTSIRTPPPVFGLGLIEAIPEADILAAADPDDADGDGISGRPNWVWSRDLDSEALGRFGLKANVATLVDQAAGAFAADMGVSSPLVPDDSGADITAETVARAAFYTRTLAVVARAPSTAASERGFERFYEFGCAGCHTPVQKTGPDAAIADLRHQTFAPFTDVLVHDMGEDLADHRPDFEASGREWRTAALWGIGMTERVLGDAAYLHDGRARSLSEAILWHGGEAEGAREAFRTAAQADRDDLLAFLRTL